jgi:hypothetical protein
VDIFDKINELNLQKDKYVVVAGGVLVALGLLDWDEDVDITVTNDIFEDFKNKGWKEYTWKGKPVLKRDVYDVGIGFGQWSLRDLQSDTMWINDIPFMSLNKLLVWKKQMGREKDFHHIELIENYMTKESSK